MLNKQLKSLPKNLKKFKTNIIVSEAQVSAENTCKRQGDEPPLEGVHIVQKSHDDEPSSEGEHIVQKKFRGDGPALEGGQIAQEESVACTS